MAGLGGTGKTKSFAVGATHYERANLMFLIFLTRIRTAIISFPFLKPPRGGRAGGGGIGRASWTKSFNKEFAEVVERRPPLPMPLKQKKYTKYISPYYVRVVGVEGYIKKAPPPKRRVFRTPGHPDGRVLF